MKKLILFLLPLFALAQNPTSFPYGIKNSAAISDSTPAYFTTTQADGVHKKTPASTIAKTDELNKKQLLSTGLIKNGLITINSDPTKYNITAGIGIISNFDDPENPTSTIVSFPAFTGITPTYLTTGNITYIAINSSSAIVMQAIPFTNTQRRDLIILGAVIHSDLTTINLVNNISAPTNAGTNQLHDLMEAIGALNVDGNKITANGANLSINKSAGDIFKLGVNFANNWKDPNKLNIPSQTLAVFRYRTQNGTEGGTVATLNPAVYDVANVLTAVPSNRFSIQTVTLFQTGAIRVQYGQATYATLSEAESAINTRTYNVEANIAANGITRAYIILKNTATSLQNTSDCKIIEAGKFGNVGGSGGAITLDAIVAALGYTPENQANKSDSYTASSSTTYASTKALVDGLGTKANAVSLPMGYVSQRFVFTGDSLTYGLTPPNTVSYPMALALRPPVMGAGTSINAGSSGSGIAGLSASYVTQVYPHRPAATGAPRSVLFVWIGANDYQNIATYPAATYIGLLEAYWQQAKTDGFTVVAFTVMSRTGDSNSLTPYEINRRAINEFIRNSNTPDILVDAAILFPNPKDLTFFLSDGSHLNNEGNKKLAEHVSSCLMSQGTMYKSTTNEPSLYPEHSSAIGGVLDKAAIKFGSSLTGYGTISPAVANIGSGPWSFESWVKFPDIVSGQHINIIAQSGGAGFGVDGAGIVNTGGRIFFETATGYSNLPGLLPEYWYHVAAVKSGTTVSYYVNGVAYGTGTDSSTGSTLNIINLGAKECSIARVRVFNYSKTAAQILTDYRKLGVFDPSDSGCTFALADSSTAINNVVKDLSAAAAIVTFQGASYVTDQLPLYPTTTSGIGKYGTGSFGMAEFSDSTNFGNTNNYAFLSDPAGDRYINAKTGKRINFGVNNSNIAYISSLGLAATSIILNSETASTIASFDFAKNIKSLSTATYPNLTELSYLKGITGAINVTYAPLVSPTFTGTPTAPTATTGTNTTQIATTAFANSASQWELSGSNILTKTNSIVNLGNSVNGAWYDPTYGSFSGQWINGSFTNGSVGIRQNASGTDGIAMYISSGQAYIYGGTGRDINIGTSKTGGVINGSISGVIKTITGNNRFEALVPIKLKSYTVATLPTGTQGDTAYVTDAITPTYLGILVGGGTIVTPVFYNGTNWISH